MTQEKKQSVQINLNISTAFLPTAFFARWVQWSEQNSRHGEDAEFDFEFPFVNLGSGVVNLARCQQVEQFIEKSKADWFVNIDVDQSWGKDGISQLLKTDGGNCDIVSAVVHSKIPPFTPCFYHWKDGEFINWDKQIPDQPFYVDAVGFGMIGIKRHVLESLWQAYGKTLFDRPVFNKWDNIFMGEDVAFCYKAGLMGFQTVMNPLIETEHFNYVGITKKDFDRHLQG